MVRDDAVGSVVRALRRVNFQGSIFGQSVAIRLGLSESDIDALELLSHSGNLGDARTIVTHPASSTHAKLTEAERERVRISQGMIRISVGLEHIDDIVADVEQALTRSATGAAS